MKRLGRVAANTLLAVVLAALAVTSLGGCAIERQRLAEAQRSRAFDLYNEAEQLEREGNYHAAQVKYLAALEVEERPAFVYKVGRMHHLLGDPERALIYYDRALKQAPHFDLAATHRELARLEVAGNNAARALEAAAARPAPDSVPTSPPSPSPVSGQQPAPTAPVAATTFESLDPAEVRAVLFAELVQGETPTLEAARRQARSASEQRRWAEAVLGWTRVLESAPDDIEARLALARAYLETNRARRAMQEYQIANRIAPNDPEILFQWANALVAAEGYEEAEQRYLAALEAAPDMVRARNNLGALYLTQGRYQESIAELRRVLEATPDFAPAHLNLARALDGSGAGAPQALPHVETYLRLGGEKQAQAEQYLVRLRTRAATEDN